MPRIKIDHGKCTGCKHCEAVCSLKHYENEKVEDKGIYRWGTFFPGNSRPSC